ncbi:mevalonate kinase, putative [Ichthyophthirius multifiliis]|uniref:Mevalonate kinase, putative n=1 Tax=Ichthyophthirius multifiliis TaxID=5932 RepID=G0R542_ICHMU|nr:mevalonate kinase, putative [Ichthyophthirius multifiliis]EGR27444.1 mevalonate kinase, putative [Ichthyophthirius multifiliis]|eukprot:XP_004024354.1 mevalonate kinase, putative [Ichthyophthirius multifiliis]
MQQSYTYSSPGKVIISGEHSVVYNKTALVMSIDLRTKINLKIVENQESKIEIKNEKYENIQIISKNLIINAIKNCEKWNIFDENNPKITHQYKIITYALILVAQQVIFSENTLKKLDFFLEKNSFLVNISSNLPISKGLGSSASFLTQ